MRLTTYADYSLRLLIYLAVRGNGLATIPEIAESYGISRHHLVKVAHQLGVKGYISTVRGKNGGLRLARSAAEINVADVILEMEPDMAMVPCFTATENNCPIVPSCALRSALDEARDAFIATLGRYTVQDLAASRNSLRQLLHITPLKRAG